jgi:hypothetical protein
VLSEKESRKDKELTSAKSAVVGPHHERHQAGRSVISDRACISAFRSSLHILVDKILGEIGFFLALLGHGLQRGRTR